MMGPEILWLHQWMSRLGDVLRRYLCRTRSGAPEPHSETRLSPTAPRLSLLCSDASQSQTRHTTVHKRRLARGYLASRFVPTWQLGQTGFRRNRRVRYFIRYLPTLVIDPHSRVRDSSIPGTVQYFVAPLTSGLDD